MGARAFALDRLVLLAQIEDKISIDISLAA
jgi:hypothetical protein